MEFEPNCVGYAFKRLKIEENEKYIDPLEIDWVQHFVQVGRVEEADAIVVTYHHPMEGEIFEHIAIIDNQDKSIIHHRRYYGSRERVDTLTELLNRFSNSRFDIKYVKLKPS